LCNGRPLLGQTEFFRGGWVHMCCLSLRRVFILKRHMCIYIRKLDNMSYPSYLAFLPERAISLVLCLVHGHLCAWPPLGGGGGCRQVGWIGVGDGVRRNREIFSSGECPQRVQRAASSCAHACSWHIPSWKDIKPVLHLVLILKTERTTRESCFRPYSFFGYFPS